MRKPQLREVKCKTVLRRLDFHDGWEYTANFYRGCLHGCVYCYAPSLIHDERAWGSFVDAKVNAPQVLQRELRQARRNVVFLSSATDPYQAPEARYRITRRCLEVLLSRGFPVSILTRSPLVLRDIDLLRRFEWVRVGFSISTVAERTYEPGVPSLQRRIDSLRRLSLAGIRTWVSLAPIVPKLITMDIEGLIKSLAEAGVSHVSTGLLRFQGYEESRALFESTIKGPAEELMRDGAVVLENVRKIIRDYSLDLSKDVFEWRETESRNVDWFGNCPGI